ncbi:MAG: Beta-barrel assembly-enhancing protease [Phycisphaerae bacterium]|nr:Beta-barrel assembly-enhancing protease [Phycisphaerae bacterium]
MLALLSKTVTCTLPAVIVVLIWWKRGGVSWRALWPTLPLFAIGVGFAFVTIHLEKTNVGATGADWQLSTIERVLLAGRTSSFYAGKLLCPIPLMTVYPRWEVNARQAGQWLYPLGVLAVLGWLWFARGRLGRGALAAALCFLGTLLPALGFFDVYPFRYSFVADHYAYLASVAIIALLVAAVGEHVRTLGATARFVGAAATAALVLACGLGVWSRGQVYRDAFALWSDAVAKNPAAWVAHLNLGAEFQKRGDLAAALRHDEAAVRLKGTYPDAHYNYANDLQRAGRPDDALRHFNEALRLRPDYADAHFNLAKLLAAQNQPEAALRHFGDALASDPNLLAARCDLALELLKLGRLDEAIRALQDAIARDANADEAHYRLGIALCAAGRIDEGVAAYRTSIRLQPDNVGRRLVLARVLLAVGRPAAAVAELRECLARQADQVDVLTTLARTLATCSDASVRNGGEAMRLAQRAVDLTQSAAPQALDALAAACAESGDFPRALQHIRAALELARRAGDETAVALFTRRMSLYERSQPCRE